MSPESHTLIDGANVTFSGRTVALDGLRLFIPLSVFVDYLDASGAWIQVGSALVPSDGLFALSVTPPEGAFWGMPCGSATFRVRDSFGVIYSALDRECLDDPPTPGASCSTNLIVLQRRVTHDGDLSLHGQAEADAYQCLNTVLGNLTVVGGRTPVGSTFFAPGLSFSLPQLRDVTGDLSIDGDRTEHLDLPLLTNVGGTLHVTLNRFETLVPPSTHTWTSNFVDAPRLTTVAGSVDLVTFKVGSPASNPTYDFALPALTSVGADVTIHNPVFPGYLAGLPALTSIPGGLVFDFGVSDLNSVDDPSTAAHEGILPLLAAVGADAELVLPPNANVALGSLRTVGGTLTVRPAGPFTTLRPTIAPLLASVGGDMTLRAVRFSCAASPRWPALASLGGSLNLDHTLALDQPFGATGATHLRIGGLLMDSTTSAQIPLHGDVAVRGAGPVTFTNNADLCPCQIQAFASSLTSAGWTGALTDSGNGASATCTPCPAPASCP